MKLIFLTQEDCSGCKILKRKLISEDVEFEEIDVTVDVEAVDKYSVMSTPVLILSDEDDEISRIVGYSPAQEDDVDEFIAHL